MSDKTKSRLARCRFSKETNNWICFCCLEKQKSKKNRSFVRFLGESTTRQSALGFIWPLECYIHQEVNRVLKEWRNSCCFLRSLCKIAIPSLKRKFQKLHSKLLRIIYSTFLRALNSQLFGYFFEMKTKQSRKDSNTDKTTALDNVTNELECSCLQPHAFNSSTLGPSANCNQVCTYNF